MLKKYQKIDKSESSSKKSEKLIQLLEEGEKSGFIKDFDPQRFLKQMHKKYSKE